MTTEKAREFYSAYFEGSLEPGLRLSFDVALRENAEVSAEYEFFAQTMRELDAVGKEEIPIPADLHARIVERLEADRTMRKPTPLFLWRNFAYAAAAAVLIGGAFLGVLKNRGGVTMQSGMLGGGDSGRNQPVSVTPEFSFRNKQFLIHVPSDSPQTLNVLSEPDLKVLKSLSVTTDQDVPLANPNPDAAAFQAGIQGQADKYLIALPGSLTDDAQTGQGDVVALAMAVAGHYGVPVIVSDAKSDEALKWDFTNHTPAEALQATLNSQSTVNVMGSGLVKIDEH